MIAISTGGATRLVILVGPWAVKVPRFGHGWAAGLRGLLANMQERHFTTLGWPELCPVVWSLPGGWVAVMRRAEPLPPSDWDALDVAAFRQRQGGGHVPVEAKADSFGLLDGRVVAVDYGS